MIASTGDGDVGFAEFCENWLADVTAGSPLTNELGTRFSRKLVTQWLDIADESMDLIYCDGTGDGGIDIAFLDEGDEDGATESDASGHTWYLVQSKYGTAFQGPDTLLREGQKVIDTLDGKRHRLSSLAEGLVERLTNFRAQSSEKDRIVLVFATVNSLSEGERRTLTDLRAMGRDRLGPIFEVEAVSVETIHLRLQEQAADAEENILSLPLHARLVPSGEDLLVGSVALTELYAFLKRYRDATDDLDRLYEKNVRRFLGGRGKVNRGIQSTLRSAPERFGLYNNGITIVVSDYRVHVEDVDLIEPYVVNGCQTTKTIWEVFHNRLDAGGTGASPELDEWRLRAEQGVVVLKVAKVGSRRSGAGGENLLEAITRYTNSQNAVREKDFLALTGDFRTWQTELANERNLYLEIQRGGWDSQRALQKQRPSVRQFKESANAADLIKVYGAGWLGEPGTAFGKNAPFLPNGAIFKRIVNREGQDGDEPFGPTDLFAAYLLQQAAMPYGFGRGAERVTRRQSRFLFYMVAINLLKDVLSRSRLPDRQSDIAKAIIKVSADEVASRQLYDLAVEVIDAYFTQGTEDSVFDEPSYLNAFNSNLNGFLKWEQLGKSDESSPRLKNLLAVYKSGMGRVVGGAAAPRDILAHAVGDLVT